MDTRSGCSRWYGKIPGIFGLCERAFIAVVALWFLTASGTLAFTLR